MHARRSLLMFALICGLSGCAADPVRSPSPVASPDSSATSEVSSAGLELLPPDAVVDYQLGGAYPPDPQVTAVTRDSTADPAAGIYSICYINGFQTQPGVPWPSDLILRDQSGQPVTDENWPDENILDISSVDKRTQIAAVIGESIELCAAKGFQAVEFDNFDSFTRSGNQLTQEDAIVFATELVRLAHGFTLPAGQKNAAELVAQGHQEVGFDFAVVEECDQFEECSEFTEVYGSQVIDIEYVDQLRRPFATFCTDPLRPAASVLRDRNLVSRGSPGYVLQFCDS